MIVLCMWSGCAVFIVCSAVIIIIVQSVPDGAVIVRSCGRLLVRPIWTVFNHPRHLITGCQSACHMVNLSQPTIMH